MISAKVKGTVEAVIQIFLATKKKNKKKTPTAIEKRKTSYDIRQIVYPAEVH